MQQIHWVFYTEFVIALFLCLLNLEDAALVHLHRQAEAHDCDERHQRLIDEILIHHYELVEKLLCLQDREVTKCKQLSQLQEPAKYALTLLLPNAI